MRGRDVNCLRMSRAFFGAAVGFGGVSNSGELIELMMLFVRGFVRCS